MEQALSLKFKSVHIGYRMYPQKLLLWIIQIKILDSIMLGKYIKQKLKLFFAFLPPHPMNCLNGLNVKNENEQINWNDTNKTIKQYYYFFWLNSASSIL